MAQTRRRKDGRNGEALAETLGARSDVRPYHRWVFGLMRPHLAGRVLEVGGGTGVFTRLIVERASHLVALEPDPQRAQEIDRRLVLPGRVDCVCGTFDTMPEPRDDRERFDAVVGVDLLDRCEDDVDLLRRMAAQLRPGGRLVLVAPAMPSALGELDRSLGRRRRYTRRSLRVAVEVAGLEWREGHYLHRAGYFGWMFRSVLLRRRAVAGRGTPVPGAVWLAKLVDRLLPLPFGQTLVAVATVPEPDAGVAVSPVARLSAPDRRRAA